MNVRPNYSNHACAFCPRTGDTRYLIGPKDNQHHVCGSCDNRLRKYRKADEVEARRIAHSHVGNLICLAYARKGETEAERMAIALLEIFGAEFDQ